MQIIFLVADTQLYKRLCPSVDPSVRPSMVKIWKNECFRYFCECLCVEVWMGIGSPFPPVRNDIMTLRHLLDLLSEIKICRFLMLQLI